MPIPQFPIPLSCGQFHPFPVANSTPFLWPIPPLSFGQFRPFSCGQFHPFPVANSTPFAVANTTPLPVANSTPFPVARRVPSTGYLRHGGGREGSCGYPSTTPDAPTGWCLWPPYVCEVLRGLHKVETAAAASSYLNV
ncbi:hypothetical protein ACOMHN_047629 [Nucella lapillus]